MPSTPAAGEQEALATLAVVPPHRRILRGWVGRRADGRRLRASATCGGDDVAAGGTNERQRRCCGLRLLASAREAGGGRVDLTVAAEIGGDDDIEGPQLLLTPSRCGGNDDSDGGSSAPSPSAPLLRG
ncbi:hypothetical protein OsJ_35808 [Oryza sativa Japonica Group]|nr:hypothetical protein OsJ_35808 [Oryza sativa Japonica Group]